MINFTTATNGNTTKTFKNLPSTRSRFPIFKYLSLLAMVLMLGVNGVMGQTSIITNVAGGGTLPTDWSSTNGNTGDVIDRTTFYHLETTGSGTDLITTANYDLSAYSYAILNVDITSFGSGSHNSLRVEISSASGATFTNIASYNTSITTGSYLTQRLVIQAPSGGFTSTTKFRFSNNGSSGRGIRVQNINANAPTQASNVTFSSVGTTSFTTNWTDGSNGSSGRRAIFIAATSSGTAAPVNGTTYTANTTFGSGTQIGVTGWYCVYNSTGTHASGVTVTGLTSGTTYRVMVCENEGTGATSVFNTITATNNPNNQATTAGCTAPTTQTTSMSTNTIAATSSNYAFTRGNGTGGVIVVAKAFATATVAPSSSTTYTPSLAGSFTGTTTTGTGNIVIYNGTAAGASNATGNLNITNLTAGSRYTLTAYEYNTTGTCYNTTSAASTSFYTLCNAPTTNAATLVGSTSMTLNWASVTGASDYKLDVATDAGFTSMVSGYNDFTVAGTSQAVTGLTANTTYHYRVRARNAASAASANSNAASQATIAAATQFVLVSVPTTGSSGVALTAFTVQARNGSGALDVSYSGTVTINKVSGSGTLSGTTAVATSGGVSTFSNIIFTGADTYTINATGTLTTSATSGNIVVSVANTSTTLWNGGSSAWLTSGNWNSGLPSSTRVAQFGTAVQTTVGFNMNGASVSERTVAAIEFISGASARTINNSSGNTSNNFILSGGAVNGISNVILRNNSSSLMTITNGSFNLGIALGNATNNIINIDSSGGITVSCIISGSNPLTKAGIGSGVLTLSTGNTYTGKTFLTAGTVSASGESAFGAAPGSFVADQITFNGGTLSASGNMNFLSNRGITFTGSSNTINTNANTVTLTNIATGAGGYTKTGAGILALAGAHTYTGATTLSAGTLQLAVGNVGSVGSITSSPIGTSTLNLNGGILSSNGSTARTVLNATSIGGNVTLGDATNTGALTFDAATTISGATCTLTAASAVTFAGAIGDGGSGFGITKAGAGTLTLSGANTYTGATTVNAGTLSISSIANGGSGSGIGASTNAAANLVLGGGTLQYTGATASTDRNFTLTAATTSTIDNTNQLTITGASTATTGALTKTGAGTLILSGTNLYTGATTINAGTLSISSIANGGSSSGIGASTNAAANLVLGGGTLQYTGATASTDRNFTLTAATNSTINNTNQLTISGASTATIGALTKTGAGTLILSGTNLYTGATTINAGTLSISSIANGGSSSGIGASTNAAANLVLGGGTLQYTGATASTDRNFTLTAATNSTINNTNQLTISGASTATTGALTKTGAGTLILSGTNLHTGGTVINAGTLSVGADANIGNGSVTLGGGTLALTTGFSTSKTMTLTASTTSTIDVASSQTLTANGIVSGSGNLTKTGSGTLILSAANTYTGTTTISAGTINVTGVTGITSTDFNASTQSITFTSTTPTNGTYQLFNGPVSVTAESLSSNAVGKLVSLNYTTGAVSVSNATVVTFSNTQFTSARNITRGTTELPIYRFQVDVTNLAATLSSLGFTTPATIVGGASDYVNTDITNFKAFLTTSTTFSNSTQLGSTSPSGKTQQNAGETLINFTSLATTLNVGTTYYIWLTADILNGAVAGRKIVVNAPTVGITGSVTGSNSATGVQTIEAVATNYYLNTGGSVTTSANYFTSPNGVGTTLSAAGLSNTSNDIILNIPIVVTNTGDFTLGNGSKIVVQNGGSLTVGVANTITGTIDVNDGGTLTFNNTSIPTTVGILGTTSSTVVYSASGAQAVATKNYANLTISGGNTKTISGAAAVSGTLVINSSILALGSNNISAANLTLDGSGTRSGTWGSTASAATYKNNTYFSGTGVATVTNNTALTPSISGVNASQSITYGAASITLTGSVSATGPVYPSNGETVSVTINGNTQTTTTTGGNGSFSINFTTSTIPASVTPYTITYAYAGSGFLNAASNNTTTALTVNVATNNWTGGTGTWNTAGNWSLSRVPSSLNDNITISSGTPTLNINYTLGAGRTLTISGSAALIINPSSSITIAGTADFGSRPVTVQSDNTGTGSIGTISGTLSNATNVTVQRYAVGSGRNWRFLSSPVSGVDISSWMSQFYVTGPCLTAPTGGLGSINDLGWHTSQANIDYPGAYNVSTNNRAVRTTSIRQYVESNSTSGTASGLNAGWADVATNTTLTPGKGFRAFIRGAIGTPGQLNGTVTGQTAVTINLNGTLNQGAVNAPTITYSGSGRGWNLIGNPYACAYDWANNATVKTQIVNNTIHVFNPSSNGYISYNPSSGGSLSNGIIPSGAAFFVQATGSGQAAVTFNEAAKVTGVAPTVVHKGAKANEFSIKYSKDSTESDEFIAMIIDNATLNNDGYDIIKLRNENLNLSSFGEDTMQLTLSAIPQVVSETRIKLNVEATAIGTYNFDFKNMDNFQSNITVSLFDRYTNKTTDVRKNTKYTFDMGAGVNQWGKNRFELILNLDKTNVDEFALLNQTQMLIYPNPATDVLNINISNSSFKNSEVVVYNISGAEVLKTNMANHNAQLNIETLSNGVYFVKVSNQNGFNKTVKFVK